MLGVIPQTGDGVPVVVVHDLVGEAGRAEWARRAAVGTDALDEVIHRAAVERLLLVRVVVVLVAGQLTAATASRARRRAVEAQWECRVRIAGQQVRAVTEVRR